MTSNVYTPEDEIIVLFLARGNQYIPMMKSAVNQWKVTVELPISWTIGKEKYKYCRNYMAFGAEEDWNSPDGMRDRIFSTTTTINDTLNNWRWLPADGIVPQINTATHLSVPPVKLPPPTFKCGIELPDYWWPKSFSPVVASAYDKIVKNSNSNWVQYAPVPELSQYYPTPVIIREGANGTPEADLIKIFTEAHKRGLKVFLKPFPWALVVQPSSPELHDEAWWIAYVDQWRPVVLYYAKICQQYNVEMLYFDIPDLFKSDNKIPFIDNLFQKLLDDVRNVYKGEICIPYVYQQTDFEIYRRGDFIAQKIWGSWPYRLSSSKNPSVQEMVTNMRRGFDDLSRRTYEKFGKPVILHEIAVSSFDGAVEGSINWEDQAYYFPDNPKVILDLQEQADFYESVLQAISERPWIVGAFSFNYNLWDSLDKMPSIRSKPAEKVLAKWWRWILPDNVHLSVSSKEGGSVIPSAGSYIRKMNSTSTISAIPDPGYKFLEWTGDIESEQTKMNPLTLPMNSDKNIVATFFNVPKPAITSFSPLMACKGETINIIGSNLSDVTNVSFGGMSAASFTSVSSTNISAVVGNGISGELSVTTLGGTIFQSGFIFIPKPDDAGVISGVTTVCSGQNSVTYSIPAITNASSYIWTLPNGANGKSNSNSIVVNYGNSALSGKISVKGINPCSEGQISSLAVAVKPMPSTPVVTQSGLVLHSDTPNGNQWYNQNNVIIGSISQDYTITSVGEYFVKVTQDGCISAASNIIKDVVTDIESSRINQKIQVYPNPVSDDLTIELIGNSTELKFQIISSTGVPIFSGLLLERTIVHTTDFPGGVYLIKFSTGRKFELRKVIKNKK